MMHTYSPGREQVVFAGAIGPRGMLATHVGDMVSFQCKSPDFLSKNPDFLPIEKMLIFQ